MTTPPRLLLDEMLSPKIAAQLRSRRHDATAVAERPDLLSAPDEELLALAATEGRTLVTANIGDFAVLAGRWAAAGRDHAGILFVSTATFPQDRTFIGSVVKALHAVTKSAALPGRGETGYLRRA